MRTSWIERDSWRGRGVAIALLLLLTLFFFYTSPPPREGATGLLELRARDLLGLLPPGEGTPTFPGWATWIGLLLAAGLRLTHLLGGGDDSLADFVLRTAPIQSQFLRLLAAAFAAGTVALAADLLHRLLPAPGDRPGHGATGPLQPAGPALLVLVATLLVSPLLPLAVGQISPALLGAVLWLVLARRIFMDGGRDELRWGAVSGLWLGVLLGACGWLWVTVPVFLGAALVRGRSGRVVSTALATGLAVGLALDPVRLLDPASAGSRLLTEWSRSGGWNLAAVPLGRQPLHAMLTLNPLVGWGVAFGSVVTFVIWFRDRRIDALSWWAGLGIVAVLLPIVSGIRGLELLQQTWAPLWVVAAAVAVGRLGGGAMRARIVASVLGLILVAGAFVARTESERVPPPVPAAEIVQELLDVVPSDARVLTERAIAGLAEVRAAYTLPRDSRRPGRFDFAYWPRWYSGFDYVVLSEVQVGLNLGRTQPTHFYGQLREFGEPIRRWGAEGSGWVLFRLEEGSPWTESPSEIELTALHPAPELLQFVDQLGSFYAGTDGLDLAQRLFQAGLVLDPSRDSLYNNLGSVYLLESEWEAAARVFEQGLQRNPDSPELCYNAGRAFFELGAFSRAENLLRRAVGLRPTFGEAHYELARTFLALDQGALAQIALEKVLELGPSPERRRAVESALGSLRDDEADGGEVP